MPNPVKHRSGTLKAGFLPYLRSLLEENAQSLDSSLYNTFHMARIVRCSVLLKDNDHEMVQLSSTKTLVACDTDLIHEVSTDMGIIVQTTPHRPLSPLFVRGMKEER